MNADSTPPASHPPIPWSEALRVWSRVALLSFGGPAGQIAVMHRILVEEKRWVSEERFLHALNYCMLLPGPEAQQLAIYIGWLLHRTLGGLVAGILFVLPGFVSILALSILYALYRELGIVEAALFGLKPAVLAVVVEAVLRIGKRVLKNRVMVAIAAAAFIGIFFFALPFPAIVLTAGIVGFAGGRIWPDWFHVIRGPKPPPGTNPESASVPATDEHLDGHLDAVDRLADLQHTQPSLFRALRVLVTCLVLWVAPLVLIAMTLGEAHVLFQQGIFFSKTAMVTFGGAYAVLAYVQQQAVDKYGWLQPGEMLDGLGMAETTPGPLIQVVQFVGFLGAYRHSEPFTPLTAAILGSIITTWVTYVPCFLWIFLGAPYIERLRGNRNLSCALSAITAAVVGVVLNLAVWFALHTLFATVDTQHYGRLRFLVPVWSTFDGQSGAIAAVSALLLFYFHRGMIQTLLVAMLLGVVLRLAF